MILLGTLEFDVQSNRCLATVKYSSNPMLGRWGWTQRSSYRLCQEGKPSPTTAERIRELENAAFNWEQNWLAPNSLTVATSYSTPS